MTITFVQFACPHCQRVIRTTAVMVGKTVTCPACECRSQVPAPPAPQWDEEGVGESLLDGLRSPFYQPPTGER